MYALQAWITYINHIAYDLFIGLTLSVSVSILLVFIGLYINYKLQEHGMLFADFRIKRLQEKILQREDYKHDIRKIMEELHELRAEFEKILMRYDSAPIDLRNEWGNLQKEMADVEAVLCKSRLMFLRTYEQRRAYRIAKSRIVCQLQEFLEKAGRL